MRIALITIALCIPGTALLAQGPGPSKTDIPVRTVMLFSSGVGYFEHAGTVHGNGSTELRFKTSQINDILKSLVLQDQDGGQRRRDHLSVAGSARQDASKLSGRHHAATRAWPDLLNQLRGAQRHRPGREAERAHRHDPRRREAAQAGGEGRTRSRCRC